MTLQCPLGKCQPVPIDAEAVKRDGWNRQGILVVSRDDQRLDAAGHQQLQPLAVERAEGLDGFAVLADVEPPVGQHAIDVEDRGLQAQAAALRAQQQLGRKAWRGQHGRGGRDRGRLHGLRSPWHASGRWC